MNHCDACPVDPALPCLGMGGDERFGYMCGFARSSNELERRHVVERSAIGANPASPPPQEPGLLAKGASFTRAVVRHVANGMPTAAPEQVAARLAICRACENFLPIGKCKVCGCALMAMKASMALERCPLEPPKWGPITPATEAVPQGPRCSGT